jgi:DMSO/TMAO reductase YedYZ molybdopterin-dependent catalytic subunit
MTNPSRRKLLTLGLGATAGVSGLAAGAHVMQRYGLVPPNHGNTYVPGETLTYASHRLLTRQSSAREFSGSEISKTPFPRPKPPETEEFKRLQAGEFSDWRITIEGMVARPATLSLADLKSYPVASQITQLACEEGWSFVAEWIGVPLHYVLQLAGIRPDARYVVYASHQRGWWDSVDMADALHPQTLLTYAMNGDDLPVGHGGPVRMRVPRQLGYKSVKWVNRLVVTEHVKKFPPHGGYSWYAGI